MKPRISPDRIKLFGWAVILIFCLAGGFVLRETPPGKSGLAALTFFLAFLAAALSAPALWAHLREASPLYNCEFMEALLARRIPGQQASRPAGCGINPGFHF